MLSRSASEIRVSDIIEVVEGPISPVECVDSPDTCVRSAHCVTREIWEGLKQALHDTLSAITLEKLTTMQKDKIGKGCPG